MIVDISEGNSQNILENSGNQNKRIGKRRKDKVEEGEEDEDGEEEGEGEGKGTGDGDDLSSQKKLRVVWSVNLHRKFICVVNKLDLEKVVPKKILDLMNVEGLARENVVSHLQVYILAFVACITVLFIHKLKVYTDELTMT
ncbi:unnamed protein product [Lathyrus sativus]|nr:unnamed protein product [Lathyrus sativus]